MIKKTKNGASRFNAPPPPTTIRDLCTTRARLAFPGFPRTRRLRCPTKATGSIEAIPRWSHASEFLRRQPNRRRTHPPFESDPRFETPDIRRPAKRKLPACHSGHASRSARLRASHPLPSLEAASLRSPSNSPAFKATQGDRQEERLTRPGEEGTSRTPGAHSDGVPGSAR